MRRTARNVTPSTAVNLQMAHERTRKTGGSVPSAGKGAPVADDDDARPARRANAEAPAETTKVRVPMGQDGSAAGTATGSKRSLWFRPSVLNVKLIYAGYLSSLAIPFLAIIAAFYAWKGREADAPDWLVTHYTYQLRTFWIGLAANLIAYALSFVGVGLLLFPLIAIWLVARAVHGLIVVAQRDPIRDPKSYFV